MTDFGEDDFLRAVAAFEAAPFEPEQWEHGLDLFARAGGGWAGQLLAIEPDGSIVFNLVTRMSSDAVVEWERRGGSIVGVNPRAQSILSRPFSVTADDDFLSRQEQQRSPFYQELFRPFDAAFMSVGRLRDHGRVKAIAGAIRSHRQGHAGKTDHERISRLLPYVDAALRTSLALGRRDMHVAIDSLQLLSLIAFACDASGRVLSQTEAAEAAQPAVGPLAVRERHLVAVEERHDAPLQEAIRRACTRGLPNGRRTSTILASTPDGTPYRLDIAPLPHGRVHSVTACLVTVAHPQPVADPGALLSRMFGLTRSEAQVAIGIARGLSSTEIACDRQVSVATVRAQVHTVLQKAGVTKASALAALVGRLNI